MSLHEVDQLKQQVSDYQRIISSNYPKSAIQTGYENQISALKE